MNKHTIEETKSKIFILPKGKKIDLTKIRKLGELKSVRSGNLSRLGYWYFTIYYKDRTSYDVEIDYSYNDWGISKRTLQKTKDEISEVMIN